MKILITGFEPFGGESVNPSWQAVKLLPDEISGAEIIKRELPVEYKRSAELLAGYVRELCPDVVICTGQAEGRAAITPEMVAINLKDASAPDNCGELGGGRPVCASGPAAYFTTLPVHDFVGAMREEGLPANVSYSAGAYVCNSLMYSLLRICEAEFPKTTSGFIHLPLSKEQAEKRAEKLPCLELSAMAGGLQVCVFTAVAALKAK